MQPVDTDNKIHDSHVRLSVESAEAVILPLVKRFFQQQGMRPQAAKTDRVFITRAENGHIIAALRLCPVDQGWLLRSFSVDKDYQRQGIGTYMLQSLQAELVSTPCYCFAYDHLVEFYQRAGFKAIELQDAPTEVADKFQQYQQTKSICLMQYSHSIDE